MPDLGDITTLVVNYRTEELTRRCLESFRSRYPTVSLLVVDNGSHDGSTAYIGRLPGDDGHARVILNDRNRYHGPALDQGLRAAGTRYVLTLDSDCEVSRSGFLELMLKPFADPLTYAVGELRYKNRYGYTHGYAYAGDTEGAGTGRRRRIPYVHPHAMLLDRGAYLDLPPFVHHGAPCLRNMSHAREAGLRAVDFPVEDFILHHERGTSAQHGYGVRGRSRLVIEGWLNRLEGYVKRDPTL